MNAKQIKLLTALLEETTITGAAKKAGITRATAYKYLQDRDFRTELNRRRSECINDAVRYLQGKLALCNETLVEIIKDKDVSSQIKINAINAIYMNCKSLTETADIIERLDGIEKAIDNDRQHTPTHYPIQSKAAV